MLSSTGTSAVVTVPVSIIPTSSGVFGYYLAAGVFGIIGIIAVRGKLRRRRR